MYQLLLNRTEYKLKLKSEKSLLKSFFVVLRHNQPPFSSYHFQYFSDIVSAFQYQFVCLFEADSFYGFKIVTSTDDAASEKHVISEYFEVEFFNFIEAGQIDFNPIPLLIHFKHDSLNAKYQQV